MSILPDSTPRRVPPPCWTHQETLVLIEAYREKWFAVNRGHLRAADWNAVAAAVAASSNADSPKSSLQCRHKIEKLRKRYRSEKQRCVNYPGRFFSSWDLFPLLDSMAIGSKQQKQEAVGEGEGQDDKFMAGDNDIGDGFRVKTLGDRYLVTPKMCSDVDQDDFDPDFDLGLDRDLAFRARKYARIESNSGINITRDSGGGFCVKSVGGEEMNSNFSYRPKKYDTRVECNVSADLGRGLCFKPVVADSDKNSVSVAFRPKDYGRVDGKLKGDADFRCHYRSGIAMKMSKAQGGRMKDYGKISRDSRPNCRNADVGADDYVGFPVKSLGDVPPDFKLKNYRKTADGNCSLDFDNDIHCRSGKIERPGDSFVDGLLSPPPGLRLKNYCKIDGSSKIDVDSRVLNGFGSVKLNDIQDGGKQVVDPVAEVVSAIKLLTKSFEKVERMKMEMSMEIEKMRMDMLLKHSQMMLESQKQIVDAFAKTLLEKNKKQRRKEFEMLSPYQSRNRNSQGEATDSESIDKSGIVKGDCARDCS